MANSTELNRDVLLLLRLTDLLEVSCDRATAVRHLESAGREHKGNDRAGAAAFQLACRRANLRVASFSSDMKQALMRATPETPLVVHPRGEPSGPWTIVLDRRGSRVRVLRASDEQPRWATQEELAEDLGIRGERDLVTWTTVHAASPCAGAEAGHDGNGAVRAPLSRLLAILRPDRSDLWAVAVFAVAIGALMLSTPVAVQALVNFVAFGGAVAPVIVLALMLAVGLGFAAVLGALQSWIVEILQRRIFVRMVSDLAHRLPRVHRLTHNSVYGPELVNRFFDVITVQKMSSLLLLDGLGVLLGVVMGLIVLAFYHPVLLAFDLLIVLAVASIVFVLGRSGVRTAIGESRSKYAVAGWLEDIVRNPLTFKAPAARAFVLHRSDELTREYIEARRAHYRVLFRQIVGMLALQVAASVALLGIGGALVIRGELTLGQLVAAELIVTYVVGSIAKMGKHFESYYDLMAAVDKLGHLLDLRLERVTGDAWSEDVSLDARGAGASLRDVSFETQSGRKLLEGFSMEIRPGDRLCVTGASGLGKSTLLEMLYGSLDPGSGLVEIDGLDVRGLRLEALRERVAMVGEPEVFDGTILDNVLLGRSLPTEAVHDALRKVGLLEVCSALPDGVLTRLTSRGAPLSESQIHRLMLARAIAGKPRLMLVDGLLDVMSRPSVESVLDVLCDPRAPWTLVVVSNRDEVLRRADRVLDLSGDCRPARRAV